MTSFRQIEANRRNALRSTGPRTEDGKNQSRRNALRHGLSAETVVGIVEDIDDYKGFEAAVIADYDARTTVERELVLRLASLLWRLRRATSIETELLTIEAEILRDRTNRQMPDPSNDGISPILDIKTFHEGDESDDDSWRANHDPYYDASPPATQIVNSARQLAVCFQRVAHFDNAVLERLGRYESALARQVVQTLFWLQSARVR